jgi:hypothetical protein
MKRYAPLLLLLVLVVAARPQCHRTVVLPGGDTVVVLVSQGTCSQIVDPTGELFANLASVSLEDTLSGMWPRVTRRASGNTIEVCVDGDVAIFYDEPIDLLIHTTRDTSYVLPLLVSTGIPMTTRATALPDTVAPGGTVQLNVEVTGGRAPLIYLWDYSESFQTQYNIPDPVANPAITETYSVRVTDADGQRVWSFVTVAVASASH